MGLKEFFKSKLQGSQVTEGGRDALNTSITDSSGASETIDKNNYKTYSGQVQFCYNAYNSRIDYGAEMYGAIVDTRTVFIGGEGISIDAKKTATQKYIEEFIKLNNLNGSLLMDMIRTGEIEAKDLIVLKRSKKKVENQEKEYIQVSNIQWWTNTYDVKMDTKNGNKITKVAFTPKGQDSQEVIIPIDKAVYVKLGGTDDKVNDPSGRIHRILTDIENFSRAKYDLRKNNHLFAKVMPYFQTETIQEANAINNAINSDQWETGKGYAGTAKFSMIGPPLGALESITGEMLLSAKIISTNSGIPIHWLAWPELMSNRSTAENLLEVVNANTKRERLIWEEKLREAIDKSMVMAVDAGIVGNEVFGPYKLELPLISLANLKAIQETWIPLQQLGIISMSTLRNKIPAINPSEEKKLVLKEKKENVDEFMNGQTSDDLRGDNTTNMQEDNDDTTEDTEES